MEQMKKTIILDYWLKKLSAESPKISLPAINPVGKEKAGNRDIQHLSMDIPGPTAAAMFKIAKNSDISLFILALSGVSVLLHNYTGFEDLVIGTLYPEQYGGGGNILFCRNRIDGDSVYKDTIIRTGREVRESIKYGGYPFDDIYESLQLKTGKDVLDIFNVAFIYDKIQNNPQSLDQFDIVISLSGEENRLNLETAYNAGIYREETIYRFSRNLLDFFNGLDEKIPQKAAAIDIVGPEEKERLLYEFNDTRVEYPREKTIHGLFEEQAAKTPDKIAVIGPCESMVFLSPDTDPRDMPYVHLTYGKLKNEVHRSASILRKKGVLPGTVVGIMAERSTEMMIGLLGILKTGGAYLPIDPSHPRMRITFMLGDSGARFLVSRESELNRVAGMSEVTEVVTIGEKPGVPSPWLPGHPFTPVSPSNPAYVIYTSGTTGKPKGALIEHHSLVNRLNWMQETYPINETDTILQKTSFTFDVSVWELFWWALAGARVCFLVPGGEKVPGTIASAISTHNVTVMHFVPSMLSVFLDYVETVDAAKQLSPLKQIFASGEALPLIRVNRFNDLLYKQNGIRLANLYGPTEATIDVSYFDCPVGKSLDRIPIGKPIDNIKLYIVDKHLRLRPIGVAGELCISGVGLARGYLNRQELTEEKFVQAPFAEGERLYRTGDLSRWLPDGNIEFLGRIDSQVKIRGFRIELGAIECKLMEYRKNKPVTAGDAYGPKNLPIREAVVIFEEDDNGDGHLDVYIVPGDELTASELREYLSGQLPAYMIPSNFLLLEKIPLTPNGKVDRKALALHGKPLESGTLYQAPQNEIEQKIVEIWKEILKLDKVGIHENYFDLGGTSFDVIRINKKLNETFSIDIPIAEMFRYTTVHAVAGYLNNEIGETPDRAEDTHRDKTGGMRQPRERNGEQVEMGTGREIAVIGMAGRFPGAADIDEFWRNLENGKETISFFSDDELKEDGVDPDLIDDPDYVKAAGVLEDIEYFDAPFFGYTPKEAEIMDPQIRVFHQCVWHALEDAGYDPGDYPGSIGLYGGASPSIGWTARTLLSGKDAEHGSFAARLLSRKDYLTLRISYKLNLKGPSFVLHTACSTSLVAVHVACRAVLSGECDMALAGGVTIYSREGKHGYIYQEGMIFSPDGHCRAFDAGSKGTIDSEGAGVVVLKRLEDAVSDRDHIYAVVKGSAVGNDGIRKAGFTAASVEGEAEVIKMALQTAGVEPESIGCVETHGTGTELGDPVEIEGLKLAFNTNKKGFCALGAVKSNLGHTDSAAGVAGFIKTVLALKHGLIPPTLHFETPNPHIDFIDSPFYVNAASSEWAGNGYPRRAGVSAFGIGGTNAHVILEEAPEPAGVSEGSSSPPRYRLILLSARSETVLETMTRNLADHLKNNPGINLADVVYTLHLGRKQFNHRWMAVCSTVEDTVRALMSPGAGETHVCPGEDETSSPPKLEPAADRESLTRAGRLWLNGRKIDWREYYSESKRYRVPLPKYPFEKQRFWIDSDVLKDKARILQETSHLKNDWDMSDWFYLPSWKSSILNPQNEGGSLIKYRWLVFVNDMSIPGLLVKQLKDKEQDLVIVETGPAFRSGDADVYTINPRESRDYNRLFDELMSRNRMPDRILHLWNFTEISDRVIDAECFDTVQYLGFYSLLYIAKALGEKNYTNDIHIVVLSNHLHEVIGEEPLCSEKAPILGLLKVIPQEYPAIGCSNIDILPPEPGSSKEKEIVDALWEEFTADSYTPVIAYRNNQRWIQIFEPLHLPERTDAPALLREKGIYLVTGGLGNIGFMFSELLVKLVGARVILTGRSDFPPKREWNQYLETHHDESDPVVIKIKKLQSLEKMGGEIQYFRANAADLNGMQKVVVHVEENVGKINGVIHAAGITEGETMQSVQDLAYNDCQGQFESKVYGSIVLAELLKDRELDFCWMLSSISCVLGGLGFGAYTSANLFMDVFVKEHNRSNRSRWFSLNWDGMGASRSINAFERIFHLTRVGQVVFSRGGNLEGRIDKWIKLETVRAKEEGISKKINSPTGYERPALSDEFVPPGSPTEEAIAQIWKKLLGFEKIGIQDDFLELGGDSLRAITVISRIHQELGVNIPVTEFFNKPTIEGLAEYMTVRTHIEKDSYISIEPAEERQYYELSSAQKRLYVVQRMEVDGISYNMSYIMLLEGKIDKIRFKESFKGLIERHESLRTSFEMINTEPVQRIHKKVEFNIEHFDNRKDDFTGMPLREEEIINGFIRSFDLSLAPLLRVGLIKLEKTKHILMIDMHHIISDRISLEIFVKEFQLLYTRENLSSLTLQYKDFSEWQNSQLEKEVIDRQEEYWLKELGGEIPLLNVPTDFSRPSIQSYEGKTATFGISEDETRCLKELVRSEQVTLFMMILSIYNVFLGKISSQDDIIIGTPIVGRRHADLFKIIGFFVNSLVLRNHIPGQETFQMFLNKVKRRALEAFDNQDYQFENLVDKLDVKRDTSRNSIFSVTFSLEGNSGGTNNELPGRVLDGLKILPYSYNRKTSKFDLSLIAGESDEKLYFTFEYCTELFREDTIVRFIDYLKRIIRTVIDTPGKKISEIEMISVECKKQLLYDFNDTAAEYPKNKCIHQLFEEQVEKTPDHIAVTGPSTLHDLPLTITYRKLNEKCDRLAHVLTQKGVAPGTIVGIMAERSLELINGLLGILKAGGAYLPIDPVYPQERIDFMLKDSGAKIFLTGHDIGGDRLESLTDVNASPMQMNRRPGTTLAYIIYTSGSTGKPKGVVVEHRNVVRLVKNSNYIRFSSRDRLLLTGAIAFDITTFEIWAPLSTGVTLSLASKDVILNAEKLKKALANENISILHLTPKLFNQMAAWDIEIFFGLRYFLVGGDLVQPAFINLLREKYNQLKILHMYGPTENTTFSTFLPVDRDYEINIPIGAPISNSIVYILDRYDNLQPVGIVGELCVGGDGLARGYLNNPELTAEKFKYLSPAGDTRLYKTGDLGRWHSDGNIEFFGRIDQQVKIRGFRIELGEIESRLSQYPGIKEAVVISRDYESGDRYLCAYIVSEKGVSISKLREYMQTYLPDYMIPSYFVHLEMIPLTSNGKIDRKALPDPEGISLKDDVSYSPPTGTVEKKLVEAWERVLGRNKIGINENFFMIGGDSIKSIQIIARMNNAGFKLEMKDLFKYPVISQLAPHVKKRERIPDQSAVTGAIPITPIQRRFFNESYIEPHHYNQAVMLYSREGFDSGACKAVFSRIQEHHDALRITIKQDDGNILQIDRGLEHPLSLQECDLKNRENSLEEFQAKVNEIQAGIDLEAGPLMKLGLFRMDDGDRLLIVIHHLVVDGVSWRILFEDIETLYGQYKRGEKPVLPSKTDSFKYWSEKLSEYADSHAFLKEKAYWTRLESNIVPGITKDFEVEENYVTDARSLSITLGEEETDLLLTKINKVFRTEVNDILLTALGLGLKKTFDQKRLLIALEGHGREEILEDMDISRTVGWFTGSYPVLLDISHAGNPGRQIKEVKETLRKIPNRGIGYGVLKYLTCEDKKEGIEFRLKPQIGFNYLGQFDADVKQISLFEIAGESPGITQGLRNRREYELEINGMTANNRLTMTFSYNIKHFKPETISTLAGNFQDELNAVIAFCCAKDNIELTPGDFTFKGLSIENIDRLMELYPDAEDIYTLTPMQEGMLFHALADDSSHSYFSQMSYRMQGELDMCLVEKSLNDLLKRHDILRTAFVYKDVERPVQVVLTGRVIDFYHEDISSIGEREDIENHIGKFKEEDKERSFDLSKDVLIRVSILRTGKSEYEFTWSHHHILMDGWSVGILNTEFFEIYNSYIENRPYRLPGVSPYRTYIQWLEKQDRDESARYWANYLDSFEEQTAVPGTGITKKKENQPGYRNEAVFRELSREKTAMLNELAGRYHFTLNTAALTLWGILLGKYNGKEDVVFGEVVSGRPSELEKVESMVGLFINTVPVRIRFTQHMKLIQLVCKIQEESLAGEPYHYHPLAEIQTGSSLNQNLIEHLFIFENYPVSEQIEGYGSEEKISNKNVPKLRNVDIFEQSNYDFNVVFAGSVQLSIRIQYNGNAYDRDFVERIAGHLHFLLNQVIENEVLEIRELTLLTGEEMNRVLYEFNDTEADYPRDKTLHQLFAAQVERTPDRIALAGSSPGELHGPPSSGYFRHISYKELDERSSELAYLLVEKGVRPGSIVGLLVRRYPEMVIGMMAVLKAGGAFLPMDPDYPQNRIMSMLKESGVSLLISQSAVLDNFSFSVLQDLQNSGTEIHTAAGRPQITALNSLPIPDRSLVDYEKYSRYIGLTMFKNTIALQGSRGCPYNCAYCHKIWPKKHIVRSAENILEELKLYYRMGVRRFAFIDDIFNLDTVNSTKFFEAVIAGGLDVQLFFPNGFRGDILTPEYIDLAVKAGTVNIALSLETGSPRLQKLIRKHLNLDKLKENIRYIAQKYPQVILELQLMHGFPSETPEEAKMTLDFLKDIKWVHFPYFHILKIYPNTDMHALAMENGVSRKAIENSSNLAYHELPDSLPFDKSFTIKCQSEFFNDYFILKERLLHVLPYQLKVLTEDELIQKYNSYLPVKINCLDDLLDFADIRPDELKIERLLEEETVHVPDLNRKMRECFPAGKPGKDALRVLLLDLSQFFTHGREMLYDVVEPPLGLMYLLTSLRSEFGDKISGRIAKSRVDFDSHSQLKMMIEEFKPDIIGVRTLTFYKDFFHSTIAGIRQWGYEGPIITGGPYATSDYKTILRDPNIDLAVLGEGEKTFVELIGKMIENNGKFPGRDVLSSTPGIAFVPQEGEPGQRTAREILLLDELQNKRMSQPHDLPLPHQKSRDLSYVIFTSGSTGIPKGILVEHRSLLNLCTWHNRYFHVSENDRATQYAGIPFDASVWEIFPYLIKGAVLHIIPDKIKLEIQRLEEYFEKQAVTISFLPTQFCQHFMSVDGSMPALRVLLTGGDKLNQFIKRHYRLYNNYGPTENTVVATSVPIETPGENIPIGFPIQNTRVFILDISGRHLLPIGIPGELCIGGESLARGYLNRPELTLERFTYPPASVPTSSPTTIYKTGDLAKWLPDGNIAFLGRIDYQVKIRGFRIELGEIEKCLSAYPGIKEGVVIAKNDANGDNYLCAYTISDKDIPVSELREYLLKHLPEYMIPSYVVTIEKIPLNAAGKVDRKALPDPEEISLKNDVERISPSNALEKKLVDIWQKVLGRKNVGVNEDFFTIGGDSIKSIQIISRINSVGYKLEMKDLFQYPIISQLASHVKKLKRIPDQSTITGTIPLTPIQKAFFCESHIDFFHYNQAVMFSSHERFDKKIVKEVFSKIQAHHDALRMTYKINTENGEVVQTCHGLEYPLSFEEYDLTTRDEQIEDLETKVNEIHTSIDLANGPLMKLGLFHLDDGDRLLIVVHHLVIDGVSWRILFEDIETLYNKYKQGEKLVLLSKTDSFKIWSEKMSEYADSKTFLKEYGYWSRLESNSVPMIPKDFEVEENELQDLRGVSFTLEEQETKRLLTDVNRAFKTEINDILLTALGLGVKKTFGLDRILLAIEGHGREEILKDVDVSRTVGWFTTVYPVLVDIFYAGDVGRQIKEVKETLRRIPNKGIGYGILKYLTGAAKKEDIDFSLKPRIAFNYLGQFDADVKDLSFAGIAKESAGNVQSLRNRRIYELDVDGMTANKQLSMTFSYNFKHFKQETIRALVDNFGSELKHIIAFCCSRENIEHTPGDFTYKGLSIESIDKLTSEYEDVEDLYPLTPLQEGMLFHALVDVSSYSYFEQMSYRLHGELEIPLVEKSVKELSKRHGILRTAFIYKNVERPVQAVLRNRVIDFYYKDISTTVEREEKENFVQAFKAKDKDCSFDLSHGVLMRVSILRVDYLEYEITWSFHHILMDGWCMGMLNTEFLEVYASYLENRSYRLPEVRPYRAYIQWLEKQDKEESAKYWASYLDSFEEQTGVPKTNMIKTGENGTGYRKETVSLEFSREQTSMLNKLAAGYQVTLNTVTKALWGIVIGKYNGKEDVVFGTVVSGRPSELEGVESMVGLFINTIPVRIRLEERTKFNKLLMEMQEAAVESESHHYYPLAEIQSQTILKQNLVDHIFVFENYPLAEQIEGYGGEENNRKKLSLKITNARRFEQTNYDFNVALLGTDRLRIELEFNGNVYDREWVERIAGHFGIAAARVIENGEVEIRDITLLSAKEKNRVLYEFNNTAAEYQETRTIRELFEEQVEQTPNSIAVVCESQGAKDLGPLTNVNAPVASIVQLSYRELNEKANRLAYVLMQKGVKPDTIVSIMVAPSIEMIVGIMGILKSGGAYLPIDPGYPKERIDYMLNDSNAHLLLTHDLILETVHLPQSPQPTPPNQPHHLAYVIYTSGSTGKPKGVMVEHGSIFNTIYRRMLEYKMRTGDRALQLFSFAFDGFITSFFTPVVSGASVVQLGGDGAKDIIRIKKSIVSMNVTHFICVPSLYRSLLEISSAGELSGLKVVTLAGEKIQPDIPEKSKQLSSLLEISNEYGPTEGSVAASVCRDIRPAGVISIGKPIAGVKIYIIDKYGDFAPLGVPGELAIAGKGLARGYLNKPALTEDRFCCFNHTHERIYRTGDIARWLCDGNIEFLGRLDHQVKIRGFRIETGEIENRLMTLENIKEVVVIDRKDEKDDSFLAAYFVSDENIDTTRLRISLSKFLADYMIPAFFIQLDEIPLTPNGKIDRRALPLPSIEQGVAFVEPVDDVELKLVEIWSDVLGLAADTISTEASFFNLGGHSLKATAMLSKIHKEFDVVIPLAEIIKLQTIKGIAGLINVVDWVDKEDEELNKGMTPNSKEIVI